MVTRAVAVRRGGAGEIQRPEPSAVQGRPHQLHDARGGVFFLIADFGGKGRDIDRGIGEWRQHVADIVR